MYNNKKLLLQHYKEKNIITIIFMTITILSLFFYARRVIRVMALCLF